MKSSKRILILFLFVGAVSNIVALFMPGIGTLGAVLTVILGLVLAARLPAAALRSRLREARIEGMLFLGGTTCLLLAVALALPRALEMTLLVSWAVMTIGALALMFTKLLRTVTKNLTSAQ